MKKILSIILVTCIISIQAFAQQKEQDVLLNQRDSALPLNTTNIKKVKAFKELNLSKQQKKQIKKFAKANKKKKKSIKNNTTLTEQQKNQQLLQIRNEKHAKLEAILTPEQKEKLKHMKKEQPHRGVTNMPNERTAK